MKSSVRPRFHESRAPIFRIRLYEEQVGIANPDFKTLRGICRSIWPIYPAKYCPLIGRMHYD
jgi:hypothetical protein